MKVLALFIAFFGISTASMASNENQDAPREVMIGVSDAYIPSGFDSNSDAYVVVSGMFPNGCYRWSKAEVSHAGKTVHEVRSFANVQPGMCLMVLVPFNREVQLGQLDSGKHTVRFLNGDGTYLEKQVVIE